MVGYLLEELRDEGNYAKFKADLEDANIFIGSLIFVQELAEKVEAAVAPLRDQMDAVVIFPSMPEVMRLNKVGSFTMANLGQSKSIVADFMKSKKKQDGSSFEEGMLKLLRTLPKVCVDHPQFAPSRHNPAPHSAPLDAAPTFGWGRLLTCATLFPSCGEQVLKYLPGDKAKDAKSFMMSFQYWLGGSPENLEAFLLMLADK